MQKATTTSTSSAIPQPSEEATTSSQQSDSTKSSSISLKRGHEVDVEAKLKQVSAALRQGTVKNARKVADEIDEITKEVQRQRALPLLSIESRAQGSAANPKKRRKMLRSDGKPRALTNDEIILQLKKEAEATNAKKSKKRQSPQKLPEKAQGAPKKPKKVVVSDDEPEDLKDCD